LYNRLETPFMKILQLNHVALHVSDLAASCRFYEQSLELKQIDRPAFDFAGAWYELAPASQDAPRQELHLIARAPENAMPPRERHIALLVESIERAEAHLRSLGVLFQPPKRRPDGALQIFLRDPDGHVIELCSKPGMY
jgi:catechol 2,3-dioxygenase-like lactoylglutathione lyase family enzyme